MKSLDSGTQFLEIKCIDTFQNTLSSIIDIGVLISVTG